MATLDPNEAPVGYKAEIGKKSCSCIGCAFYVDGYAECKPTEGQRCLKGHRKDNTTVIFVKKDPK